MRKGSTTNTHSKPAASPLLVVVVVAKGGGREENKKTQFNMQYSLPLSIPRQHRPSFAQAAVMSAGTACPSPGCSSVLGVSSTPFVSSTARLSSVASWSFSSWPLGSELSGL